MKNGHDPVATARGTVTVLVCSFLKLPFKWQMKNVKSEMKNDPVATARGFVTSNARRGPKRLSLVGFFPSETVTRTAEMSVRCRGFINRPAKIESFDDLSRRQRKVSAHQIGKLSFANPAAASGVDSNRDRFSDADRIGKLNFALLSQASRDNILGDVTRHVCR